MASHDQRRFIVTRTQRDAKGKPIAIFGHLIGSGKRSVSTMQRKAQVNLIHNLRRMAVGRFNWWPNLDRIQETNAPDELPSRQVRRKLERQAAKAGPTAYVAG